MFSGMSADANNSMSRRVTIASWRSWDNDKNVSRTTPTVIVIANGIAAEMNVSRVRAVSTVGPRGATAEMNVTGVPDILTSTDLVDFGDVFVGGTAIDTVTVSNAGCDSLYFSTSTSNPLIRR